METYRVELFGLFKARRACLKTSRYTSLGVYFLAGVLSTLVTSWMFAFIPLPRSGQNERWWSSPLVESAFSSADDHPAWRVYLRRTPGATWLEQDPNQAYLSAPSTPVGQSAVSLRQGVPFWAKDRFDQPPTNDDLSTERWIVQIGLGWPARSMYGRLVHERTHGQKGVAQFAVDVRPYFGWTSSNRRQNAGYMATSYLLPLLPMWPGFALNTIFYGVLAWLMWRLPGQIRRSCRRRAGRCTRCGYDLAGLGSGVGCPECGGVT